MKKVLFPILAVALVFALGLSLPVVAQVDPPVIEAGLAPGESMTVEKLVQTPEIPPMPDIYFMSDTTGSMEGIIAGIASDANSIMAAIEAVQPDAQFGVGNYKDFPYDPYCFQHQLGITDDTAAVAAEINNWSASGGSDGSEGQFYALTGIANPGPGWRDGATKIVVWFGDMPAHDPVPAVATGLGYDITEATVTDALVAAEIRVIAIDSGALDMDPTFVGGDYASAYSIVEDGAAGQASRITAATGGVYLSGVGPDEVADAILEGLSNLPITVTPIWGCMSGLTIEFEPASVTVTSGDVAVFLETITVSVDAPQCETLMCIVHFVDDSGNLIGGQDILIDVLDITPPEVECLETVNPHGKKIPPAGSTTLPGPKGGQNEDGFYELLAEDNCDPAPMIYVVDTGSGFVFGPFASGDKIKYTEDPDATPEIKKMGSDKGKAGAIAAHIIGNGDACVSAVDLSGIWADCVECLVPPALK